MKKVPPANLVGRISYFLSYHPYWLTVTLLVVFIGLTIYTLIVYVSAARPHLATQEYLVAARDILPGAKIEEGDLAHVAYVQGYTPKNAISVEEKESVVGKYALAAFTPGDVLTPFMLGRTPGGGMGELSTRLAPGSALYYLTKQDIHAPPPGVSLHDHVDIYTGAEASGGAALAGVEVVDLGEGSGDGEYYLGLALSSSQVQTLTQLLSKKTFLQVVVLPKISRESTRLVK